MATVKFAVVCDLCGARGWEYGGGYTCRECAVGMSDRCACAQRKDDETGVALCPACAAQPTAEEV